MPARPTALAATLTALLILASVPVGHSFAPARRSVRPVIQTTRNVNDSVLRSPFGAPLYQAPHTTEQDEAVPVTTQDPKVEAPASLLFYDDVEESDGIVCARGVCVLADFDDDFQDDADKSPIDKILNSYLGPRLLLAGASVLYGSNFALGSIMNGSMPPSAGTAARMFSELYIPYRCNSKEKALSSLKNSHLSLSCIMSKWQAWHYRLFCPNSIPNSPPVRPSVVALQRWGTLRSRCR